MTTQEAIKTIEVAIGEVEWNYPMDYAVAFEMAIAALKKVEEMPNTMPLIRCKDQSLCHFMEVGRCYECENWDEGEKFNCKYAGCEFVDDTDYCSRFKRKELK